jgi:uncharacterized protein (DUF697 family)
MNKKRLPKAIMRTAAEMRETPPAPGAMGQRQAPALAPVAGEPVGSVAAGPASAHVSGINPVVPMEPAASPPAQEAPTQAGPSRSAETRRRSLARSIVERHAAYSAVGGLIPLPIANVAGITAVIVRMVKLLSDLYGVPFERDRARAIVVALMGGAMPTGLAAVTTSTLVYVVPAANLIGLAVSSLAGAACTRGIGRIFVEHFENGSTLTDFPAVGHATVNATR